MEVKFKELKHRQDYLSVDKTIAISCHGEIFTVGDVVNHQSSKNTAIIRSFELDVDDNSIKAHTSQGYAYLSSIYK
jgi:hypothetical protein